MFWLYLILLLFLMNPDHCQTQYSPRCMFLKGNRFEEYCRGVYPQEFAIKYHDDWIRVGEPFVLYRSNSSPTEFVASFKQTPLQACKIIEVISTINFTCIQNHQQDKKPRFMTVKSAFGACFPMNLYITDDLIRSCLRQNRRKEKIKRSTKTMLVYTLKEPVLTGAVGVIAANGNWILSVHHIVLRYLIVFVYGDMSLN